VSGIFHEQGDELIKTNEQPYALEDHPQELPTRQRTERGHRAAGLGNRR
jgi:hypothetical protein